MGIVLTGRDPITVDYAPGSVKVVEQHDGTRLALTTDSFVVRPLRFPGGSIGDLAVNGTVNDLAVSGARPLALSLSLILEEGLPAAELRAEVEAIAAAAAAAGVEIVAGDTKVVERGHADGMFLCTTGVGRRDPRASMSPQSLRPGDRILVSGSIGEHGTAIMLARGEFELAAEMLRLLEGVECRDESLLLGPVELHRFHEQALLVGVDVEVHLPPRASPRAPAGTGLATRLGLSDGPSGIRSLGHPRGLGHLGLRGFRGSGGRGCRCWSPRPVVVARAGSRIGFGRLRGVRSELVVGHGRPLLDAPLVELLEVEQRAAARLVVGRLRAVPVAIAFRAATDHAGVLRAACVPDVITGVPSRTMSPPNTATEHSSNTPPANPPFRQGPFRCFERSSLRRHDLRAAQ